MSPSGYHRTLYTGHWPKGPNAKSVTIHKTYNNDDDDKDDDDDGWSQMMMMMMTMKVMTIMVV